MPNSRVQYCFRSDAFARGWVYAAVVFLLLSGGCATTSEAPPAFDSSELRNRATTVVEDEIRVSAAVPSREESQTIFGVDLSSKKVQPLWLEFENNTSKRFWFMPTGLDPEYFSPLEVAFSFHTPLAPKGNARVNDHFESLAVPLRIDPQTTVSGFLYTNQDTESKFVSIDLVGDNEARNISMIVNLPDRLMEEGHYYGLILRLSAPATVQVEDEAELRRELERLPCCTRTEDGAQAEPLNVVVIGDIDAVAPAFVRRQYRYLNVSPRFLFDRPQDTAVRKRTQWTPAQPHVARFWVTPIRFRDMPVWVGQVAMPLGGRFGPGEGANGATLVDPDVDEARNDLIQDLAYSQILAKFGFVKGVGEVSPQNPRITPDGSTYHTDGLRAVFLFLGDTTPLSKVGNFGWERLLDHYRKQLDTAESQ